MRNFAMKKCLFEVFYDLLCVVFELCLKKCLKQDLRKYLMLLVWKFKEIWIYFENFWMSQVFLKKLKIINVELTQK